MYLRVSTSEQTTDNQRRELISVAERHGWTVVSVFEDAGISGAKGRGARAGLDALMKAVARREIDMVAAWSVDRLGRSLTDLLELLRELHSKGVDLFLHQQGLPAPVSDNAPAFELCLLDGHGASELPSGNPDHAGYTHCIFCFAGSHHAVVGAPPVVFQRLYVEIVEAP